MLGKCFIFDLETVLVTVDDTVDTLGIIPKMFITCILNTLYLSRNNV